MFGQLTVGGGRGVGGDFEERGLAGVDVLLAKRLPARAWYRWLAGGFAGVAGTGSSELACRLLTLSPPTCAPHLPGFRYAGALVGVETGEGGGSVGLMLGPGIVRATTRESALGLQARFDVAARVGSISFVLALQNLLLPNFTGTTVNVQGIGVGIRIR